ncbi:MAG: GAF domain-containing protein [Bacteroidetes bacterium]|nr:MAG: GAF domain-containing protein [Bacteroidota bacterium]
MTEKNIAQVINDRFPFNRHISLKKLIDSWKELAREESGLISKTARTVLDVAKSIPELLGDGVSTDLLKKHPEELGVLLSSVIPVGRSGSAITAVMPPFDLTWFYSTPKFDELDLITKFLSDNRAHGCDLSVEDMLTQKTLSAYHLIGEMFYGLKVRVDRPFYIRVPVDDTTLRKYYQIDIDPTYVDIRPPDNLPELTADELSLLKSEPENLELWSRLLPPDNFEFVGFVIMNAVDVTDQAALSQIRDVLLNKDSLLSERNLLDLQALVRDMLQIPDLDLGLIAVDTSRPGCLPSAKSIGRSLLIGDDLPACVDGEKSHYARALKNGEPEFIHDLEKAEVKTQYERTLISKGYRSGLITPLIIGGKPIGILELLSKEVGRIGQNEFRRAKEFMSIFASGLQRQVDEQEDRVEAVIKRQYTAIHPSVEWRFREAAQRFISAREKSPKAMAESIVFEKVHALYGLSDIRDSSVFRNTAIHADLAEQLGLALGVIIAASTVRPLPSLDELGYRLSRYAEELAAGLRTGDEHSVIMLLQSEVEPLFDSLGSYSEAVQEKIDQYRNAVDSELGVVYRKRKQFEDAVTMVNQCLSGRLEALETEAQKMIPHYFEKFKTDGVDYNLYAGQSLLENREFGSLDLRNLKLWQLSTMAEMVWEMNSIVSKLPMPLETAHLILVQSDPISIRFRIDEKKFDVDGAYNIRYEIIKKRIDKSVIAGSDERLTQPGKVAIVYSIEDEAAEYTQYLDYLTAAGYFEPGIERLELGQLHGVTGLRALRVTVTASRKSSDSVHALSRSAMKSDA